MKMYERSLLIDMIEAKILEQFPEYYPQSQYNGMFIKYLYQFIRNNTYSGKHDQLYRELLTLKQYSNTLEIKENTDKQTYVLTDDNDFTSETLTALSLILKNYYNYNYIVRSSNRIVFKVLFGWLPPNTGSFINLLNDETLIDYYIDGITLRPNTHKVYGGEPDSGFVCYKIGGIHEYDTIMFLINESLKFPEGSKITFASLLEELEGSKGATLNRIAEVNPENAFYELGPYDQNYLSADNSYLIIQVPYNYAISEALYIFDVGRSVLINDKNDPDNINDISNWYVAFSDPDYDNKFIYNTLDKAKIDKIINDDTDILDTTLVQYLLGDFIWRTSDSKLIAYAQNLINALYPTAVLKPDGIWSEYLGNFIKQFKEAAGIYSIFDDDVIDKSTEELMITQYKRTFNRDPNLLFNEW